MKTLHAYLTRDVLLTLVVTVAVFTFILMLGSVVREVLGLLVNRQATLGVVLKALALLIPFVLVFALPFGLLTATLLVFGRLSADQELTSVRASGISLVSLITPVLLLGIGFSGLCAFFNLEIAPRCRVAYKEQLMRLGLQNSDTLLTEDRFIDEIPGLVLYIHEKRGAELRGIWFYLLDSKHQIRQRLSAEEGTVIFDNTAKTVQFILKDAVAEERMEKELPPEDPDDPEPPVRKALVWQTGRGTIETEKYDLKSVFQAPSEPKLSDMSFRELRAKIKDLRRKNIEPTPALVQLHRQLAFSFASFGFTLIGIPLGIRAHRRETLVGVAYALGLVLVYYSFFILGQALERHEAIFPHLLLWIPNILFQGVGAFLIWRANRGAN